MARATDVLIFSPKCQSQASVVQCSGQLHIAKQTAAYYVSTGPIHLHVSSHS